MRRTLGCCLVLVVIAACSSFGTESQTPPQTPSSLDAGGATDGATDGDALTGQAGSDAESSTNNCAVCYLSKRVCCSEEKPPRCLASASACTGVTAECEQQTDCSSTGRAICCANATRSYCAQDCGSDAVVCGGFGLVACPNGKVCKGAVGPFRVCE